MSDSGRNSGEMGTFLLVQTTREREWQGRDFSWFWGRLYFHVPSATEKFKSGLVSQFFDRTDVY